MKNKTRITALEQRLDTVEEELKQFFDGILRAGDSLTTLKRQPGAVNAEDQVVPREERQPDTGADPLSEHEADLLARLEAPPLLRDALHAARSLLSQLAASLDVPIVGDGAEMLKRAGRLGAIKHTIRPKLAQWESLAQDQTMIPAGTAALVLRHILGLLEGK